MNINIKNQYDDLTVYYANELARKYCNFTLEEQKVLDLIFSQINPYSKNPTVFKLNKVDFFNKLELESKNRYPRYRKLVRGLIDKSFFEVKDEYGGKRVGVIITDSYWKPKESNFEIYLNPRFMPYLEQLVKEYTKVDLNSIVKLKSKYSLTIYKFLCSWNDESKKTNQRYITTKDLKELLGTSKEAYVQNSNFNRASFERRTVNPIIKEINAKTNIYVSFKKNYKHGLNLNSIELNQFHKNTTILYLIY